MRLNVVLMTGRERPARAEIDAAALALLARHGAQILATARRYAATPEDAEDAYARGVEILLTKAPSTNEDELIPWLKTVVKHEVRALLLKAEGFSYREICSITGWSYTKVNRLLTEGRRAFLHRMSGIQRG